MVLDLEKMKKTKHVSKRIDLENFDYYNLPYRSERSSDVEIEHEGIRAVTDNSVLVVVDLEEVWVPRMHLVDIDKNVMIVSKWFSEKIEQ